MNDEIKVEKKVEENEKWDPKIFLTDGRELIPDMSKMTIKDFRELVDPETSEDDGDKIMARIVGITLEDIQGLSYDNWRLIAGKILAYSQEPPPKPGKA